MESKLSRASASCCCQSCCMPELLLELVVPHLFLQELLLLLPELLTARAAPESAC